MTHKSDTSSRLDAIFEQFVLDGFDEHDREMIRMGGQDLDRQMSEAIDRIRGIMADREGRDALARALKEGLKNG